MASIEQHPQSKIFRIRFRFAGCRYFRSLKTTDRKTARAIQGRVEETLRLIEQGRLEVPPKADLAKFILSDGKVTESPVRQTAISLENLFAIYKERLPAGAKEETTVSTEMTHIESFLRLLPVKKAANSITSADLQRYVEKRLKEKRGTRLISPETVKREIATFCGIWNWAKKEYVDDTTPTKGLVFSKRDEKPPFMTWEEIEKRISRGGLSDDEQEDLWACLYLTTEQVAELLDYVKQKHRYPFIHPMLMFIAYTGVRRSEMIRSQIDDFDLASRTVLIREKKRSRDKAVTFRRIDLARPLVAVLEQWFANHPGGQFSFCMPAADGEVPKALTPDQARDQFRRTFQNSKWEKLKGFHVLRHSFASNLASKGVDQRVIDLWMGHQTEEMRKRYRHLLPNTRKDAIELLTA